MGCCTGCDTGIGCEGGGGACATPQFPGLTFVTSAFPFQPATGALTPKPPAPKPGDYHADRGGVLAADHSRVDYVPPPAPPTFITPPPPFWAVVNVAGLNGLRLRETPSMVGRVLGAAPNGARVWVRKANVAEVGAPAGAPMQWWEVALWTGDAPGIIGFMRAVGPQGEKNFTIPASPVGTGFDASGVLPSSSWGANKGDATVEPYDRFQPQPSSPPPPPPMPLEEQEALRQYDVLANAPPMSVTPDDLLRLAAQLRFFGYDNAADYLVTRADLVRAFYRYHQIAAAAQTMYPMSFENIRGKEFLSRVGGRVGRELPRLNVNEMLGLADMLRGFGYQLEADDLRGHAANYQRALNAGGAPVG